jgi:Ca-activated chloride channel family protein
MKSRIFLLLVAFHVLAGWLIGQTAPAASTPASAQNSAAKTNAPPDNKTPTPAQAQPQNPAKPAPPTDDDSVATLKATVNEVRVVFTVTDRHGHYIKDLKSNDFRVIDD